MSTSTNLDKIYMPWDILMYMLPIVIFGMILLFICGEILTRASKRMQERRPKTARILWQAGRIVSLPGVSMPSEIIKDKARKLESKKK